MKTKKKFGMRRHIGITAAATLIALGATACEEAYWGGKDNYDTYKGLINNFNTKNGSFDATLNCEGSDNCFWNEMHDGCSANAEDNIQNLKILLAPNIKSDASERLVVICSKWGDGEDSYELVMDSDKGNLKIGQKGITDNGSVIIDIDKYNDWLCKSDSDRKLGRLTCDEITYYLYDGNTKKYSKCDKGKCGDLAKEMPEAFKNAFNYRVCPDGYDYRAKYIGDLTNVCVKSVCNGVSINLYTDNDNCGTCGYTCSSKGEGYTCVNGMCVSADKSKVLCKGEFINPENDPRYCGAKGDCSDTDRTSMDYKGMVCEGATPLCSNGRCANACVGGQIVCEGRCVDPQTDMNFCGATGNCKDENAGEKCTDGRFCSGALCATSCQEGLFLCDDKCVDGTSNPYYCGVTSDCTEANNGTKCEDTQVCVSGKCEYNSCKEPETLCSTTAGNRCINIQSDDADNCGSCGYKCSEHPVANATANGCAKGVCQYICINNTENVGSDNTAANIRCVDTSTDVNNCGEKGKQCDPGQVCVNSKCVQNSCTNPIETLCATEYGNTCKDVKSSDADNCGACGYKCAEHPVANAIAEGCVNGVCQYKCNNIENVGSDNTAANIRCVDTSTDVNNCGKKGKKCESGQVCVNSKCVQNTCTKPTEILCATEYGNTCKDVNSTDADNCGACGYKCADHPVANAEATGCVAGVCQYKCTGSTNNVGENNTAASIRCVDTSTDVNNCGGKGKKCESGEVCVDSKCVKNSCDAPLVLCSTATGNDCIDIKSNNPNNCGACGYKCADHPVANASSNKCNGGQCVYDCVNGYVNKGTGNTASAIQCVKDGCTDDSDCSPNGLVCFNKKCVECTASSHKKCDDQGFVCNSATNTCVECTANDSQKCGQNKICNVATNTCVECTADDSQKCGQNKICNVATNTCVECLEAGHCNKNGKGICQANNKCYYTECNNDYTPSENHDSCVLKVKRCGSPATDCTEIENQTSVACENNFCVVKSCTGNTHVYNPTDGGMQTGHGMCEENTTENCGSHGNKCGVEDGIGQVATCEASTTPAQCEYSCATDFTDCSSTSSGTKNSELICLKKGSGWGWSDFSSTCKNCVTQDSDHCTTGQTCNRSGGAMSGYTYSCSNTK